LIALIINAHPLGSGTLFVRSSLRSPEQGNVGQRWTLIRKTSLSSDRSDSTAVKQCRQKRNTIAAPRNFRCVRPDRISALGVAHRS
jgi:hypothetical protein